jgi:PAS domain S-box-containing protein
MVDAAKRRDHLMESSAHRAHPHLVQLYEGDAFLLDELTRFVGVGLGAGEAVVVVATEGHVGALIGNLEARGIDTAVARERERLIVLDARETLAAFMVDGVLDERRFRDVVGKLIARAIEQHGGVRAFGEMVALLWAEGRRDTALHLEELWNDLARTQPFALLCAYPVAAFRDDPDETAMLGVFKVHSHVIPAANYVARAVAVEELKEHQRRAEEAQARLAAIVESSEDAIVGKTLDGIVTSWNSAAERMFGYTAAEMIGEPVSRLIPADRRDDLVPIFSALRRGDRVEHFDTERVRKDGTRIQVSLTISPIRDADGRIIGASKIARDVSERRAAERAKDEFLAMLGHELRNPLAAVQSAIIAARLDASRREDALEIAGRQAVQLRRLVDDLLDVARVTQGKITLRKRRLFLATIVERAVEATRTQIEERGHALSVSLPPEIEIDADAGRLEQVLVNLLSNAAKYTPVGGRIDVSAARRGDEIVLRVRDNGIGIGADMLSRVFELFSQASRSLDRTQGGLGLGLALAKRLVELHGGRVEARSDGCGQGSEFIACLPVGFGGDETQAAGAEDKPGAEPAASARVLLVEDNVDAADALAMLLEILGHEVQVVHDGVAALDAVQARTPDVMLVDIGLPGIDGFEVARRVRAIPSCQHVTLVALTGYGRSEDKERTRAAGFDHHLTKPVEIDALQGLVATLAKAGISPARTPTLQ